MTGLPAAIRVESWGRVPYDEAWARQREIATSRAAERRCDTLILCEHPPVYTVGRQPGEEPPTGPIPVRRIDRGGGVTYHGPGQVVVYAVARLDRPGRGLRWLTAALEGSAADVVRACGLEARERLRHAGVWASRDSAGWRKIASLGLSVRQWVSTHGLALNVDPDLEPFRAIRPCGLDPEEVSSLRALGAATTLAEAGEILVGSLRARLAVPYARTGTGRPEVSTAT